MCWRPLGLSDVVSRVMAGLREHALHGMPMRVICQAGASSAVRPPMPIAARRWSLSLSMQPSPHNQR